MINPEFEAAAQLARYVLSNHEKFEWSFHGLGFLRLYLSREVRLHVWDTRYAKPASPVHSHPWSFDSLVIAGVLKQRRFVPYRRAALAPSSALMYDVSLIRCGAADDAAERTPPERVWLNPQKEECHHAGATYYQAADEVHHSYPEPGTVTLVTRKFKADPDRANVYWPAGTDFKPAAPWHITPEDISAIIANALTWF